MEPASAPRVTSAHHTLTFHPSTVKTPYTWQTIKPLRQQNVKLLIAEDKHESFTALVVVCTHKKVGDAGEPIESYQLGKKNRRKTLQLKNVKGLYISVEFRNSSGNPRSLGLHLQRMKNRPQKCGPLSFHDTEDVGRLHTANNRLTFATQNITIDHPIPRKLNRKASYLWHTHYKYDQSDAELIIVPRGGPFLAKGVVCAHENTRDQGKVLTTFGLSADKTRSVKLTGMSNQYISLVLRDLQGTPIQFKLRLRRPQQGDVSARDEKWKKNRQDEIAHRKSQPISGFADLHNHQASSLAFGGDVGHGYVHGSHAGAQHDCDGQHAGLFGMGTRSHPVLYTTTPEEWWPHASDGSHAQTHETQLMLAHQGGLKLLVATAVANETLCAIQNPDQMSKCDDMDAALNQIMALRQFEKKNAGWYKIVNDPWDARRAISDGKLAVVLGLELSNLMPHAGHGDWREQLDELYDLGVRSIELAHEADSRFAGSAHQQGFIYKIMNRFENPNLSLEELVDAADLPSVPSSAVWEFREANRRETNRRETRQRHHPPARPGARLLSRSPASRTARRANEHCNPEDLEVVKGTGIHCNSKSLTEVGEDLVEELMARHMMIPLDHMSRRARKRVCEIAIEHDAYPVFASHTRADILHQPEERTGNGTHEYMMSEENFDCIQKTGGVVGVRPSDHALREIRGCINKDLTCWGSAESVAQNFCYGANRGLALAIGSDFAGPVKMMAPSAGHDSLLTGRLDGLPAACPRNVEMGMVTPFGYAKPQLEPKKRNGRDDDYEVRGLAHTGFLPDALAEIENLGAPLAETRAHYSAESFLRMWERQFDETRGVLCRSEYMNKMGTSKKRYDLTFEDNDYNPVRDNVFKRCIKDRAANLGTCNEEEDWEELTLRRLKAEGWRRRHCGCRVVGEPMARGVAPLLIAGWALITWLRRQRTATSARQDCRQNSKSQPNLPTQD